MKTKTVVLYPPKFVILFTGVMVCEKGPSKTSLVYTDGTRETVNTADIPETVDWEDFISIDGGIQGMRPPKA